MTANEILHIHKTIPDPHKDSIELSTPAKGGALKIYGDFSDPDAFKGKIDAAIGVREYAAARLAGEAPPVTPKKSIVSPTVAALADAVIEDGKNTKPPETHEKAPRTDAPTETVDSAEVVPIVCTKCGAAVEKNQAELSEMLIGRVMCKACGDKILKPGKEVMK